MAGPSLINPLYHVVNRQYNDHFVIKNRIFKERFASAKNLYRKDLVAHYGCVNAIEFSTEGELLVSGGDDRRVLLWKISKSVFDKCPQESSVDDDDHELNWNLFYSPIAMKKTHNSNIFCVSFDSKNQRIFSGGNDDQVIIHEVSTGNQIAHIPHKKPVYGLSVNPKNDEIIATAGEDGRILLYDVREVSKQESLLLAIEKKGFHSVMFNPVNPRFLVTANSEEGISLWDCRKPKEELLRYDSSGGPTSGISACFDSSGKKILALRRRLPPVLYHTQFDQAICQFYHPQYYNSCTMKTCCFAGENDEYVLSGSDDFNLYMWKVPPEGDEWGGSHVVLKGHRSIVNQVRYNKHNNFIASSGVEKMIKLWSTMKIGMWSGSLLNENTDNARKIYTLLDYRDLLGSSGERITHDYSDRCIFEDTKMMAFFDSLIQKEIEDWVSPDESDDHYTTMLKKIYKNRSNYNKSDKNRKHKNNKIAQLICKKRNQLAKMAFKNAPSYLRMKKMREEEKRRKEEAEQELKIAKNKRSYNSYLNRLKSKSIASTAKKSNNKEAFHIDDLERLYFNGNVEFNGPSTSTGITQSNSLLHRNLLDYDSDADSVENNNEQTQKEENEESSSTDDDTSSNNNEEENFINILPTPLNGSQEQVINGLNNNNNDVPQETTSSSNDTFSVSSSLDYDNNGASTSRECTENHTTKFKTLKRRRLSAKSNSSSDYEDGYGTSSSSSSNDDPNYLTPAKRQNVHQSDSGCGTGGSSSTKSFLENFCNSREKNANSSYFNNNNNKRGEAEGNSQQIEYTSDEDQNLNNRYEQFRKRAKKACRNIRNHVRTNNNDSDSN